MKKISLLFSVLSVMVLLSNCTGSDSKKIVVIPDPNFKAYLLEHFDKNKDGQISLAEAKAVKEIDCSGRNIKDLTGIEHFKNLISLNCSDNQLDEVILHQNSKINWLACKNNSDEIKIYFGMSSALRNPKFNKPVSNSEPNASVMISPVDLKKCSYDDGKTVFVISFEH